VTTRASNRNQAKAELMMKLMNKDYKTSGDCS